MKGRAPGPVRWILAAAAWLVPSARRGRWIRQWTAEVEHRAADPGRARGLVRFALGAFAHAVWLRREATTGRGLGTDLLHSARGLLRRPGLAALTVATLAAGIGSATAVFSLAEALVLRPLPLEHDDRLVRVFSTNPSRGAARASVSWPDFADFAARADLFEAASFYATRGHDVSGDGDPERIETAEVHEGFFQTLGSPVDPGRAFTAEDHDPRSPRTAILSRSYWQSRRGSDPGAIGSEIRLDGVPHTVVGVVDGRAAWPPGARVWTPLRWGGTPPEGARERANHSWQMVGRLRPGVAADEASARLHAMAEAVYAGPGIDDRDRGTGAVAVPLRSSEAGEGAGALFATLGAAVLLVLLIACMNASGLLLTRAWGRSRELSLRSALGAGRTRLVAILLAESAVLAALGGALGVGVAHVGLERAFAVAPPSVTALGDVRLDTRVLAAGAGISLLAALLAGLLPAVRVSRASLAASLAEGGAPGGEGRSGSRLRRGLVVAQLAFSLALLVAAGLTVRGLQRQLATDPGFEAGGLLSFTVRLPSSRYGDDPSLDAYFRRALERLEGHPAVVSAAVTSRLPLGAGGISLVRGFAPDGTPDPPEGTPVPAAWVEVDPGWFETLDVSPVAGRAFTRADGADSPPVAVVNERMARLVSPGEPVVGRRIRSVYDENLPRTVVGVVPDVQMRGVSRRPRQPLVLVPRAQAPRASMAFLVRTAGEPDDAAGEVRRLLAELDPDLALDGLRTLRDAHAADLAGIRFLTTLFGSFGALALLLSLAGVYGLVSWSVSRRTREIGVRMALGATARTVRGAVVRESAVLTAVGLSAGLLLAWAAGRVLASGMDGVATIEASTYAAATLLLAVAVLVATWVPAARATRIDPVEALRSD